jgi:hypothetical protein
MSYIYMMVNATLSQGFPNLVTCSNPSSSFQSETANSNYHCNWYSNMSITFYLTNKTENLGGHSWFLHNQFSFMQYWFNVQNMYLIYFSAAPLLS